MKSLFSFFFSKGNQLFLSHYDRIVKAMKTGTLLTRNGDRYSTATANSYERGKFSYIEFEKEYGTILLEDLSALWVETFSVFLMRKGYAKNSIFTMICRFKAIANRLYKEGLISFDARDIPIGKELTTAVYSSLVDIHALLDLDLSETPGYQKVRDVYVINCFIGLRVGDLLSFLSQAKQYIREINNRLFIEIRTSKTQEVVVIPVAKVVKQLLEKHDFSNGRPFTYQYYNLCIKKIARMAAITDEIVHTRTQGGKRVDRVIAKCDLMASHSARRTFATLAFLAGVPEKNIMLITSHKTTEAFQRYIRCSSLDAAIKIAHHDFFNLELPSTISLPIETRDKDSLVA